MIRFSRAPLAALASSALLFSAIALADPAAPPTPHPPFDLSLPSYATSYGNVTALAAGSNGTDFLVAWLNGAGAFCARFTAAGVLVDQDAFAIDVTPQSVTWDGHHYVIAGYGQSQRFDPAAGSLTPAIPLRTAQGRNDNAVAVGNGVTADVWTTTPGDLALSLSDANGNIFADAIALPESFGVTDVGVGYSDGHFLVAWVVGTTIGVIKGVRVSAAGVVEDSVPFVIDPGTLPLVDAGGMIARVASVRVSGGDSGFLVTWADARFVAGIYASRVSTSGAVADVGGFEVETSSTIFQSASATWTGSAWWVVSQGIGKVWSNMVGTDKSVTQETLLGYSTIGIEDTVTSLAGAVTPTTRLGVWGMPQTSSTAVMTQSRLMGAREDGAGHVLDSPPVQVGSYLRPEVSVATVGSSAGYAAFWWDDVQAYVDRVATDGTLMGPKSGVLQDAVGYQEDVLLGALSDRFFGAANRGAYGGIGLLSIPRDDVGSDGGASLVQPLGTATTNNSNNPYAFGVTCLPDRCLVLWEVSNPSDTIARVFDPAGTPIGGEIALGAPASNLGELTNFVLDSDHASSFLVIISDKAYRITKDGILGSTTNLGGDASSVDPPKQLAWGKDRYLLMQRSGRLTRLSSAGTILGATEQVPSAPGDAQATRLGWDGRAFLLYYAHSDGSTTGVELSQDAPSNVGAPFTLAADVTVTSIASAKAGSAFLVGTKGEGNRAQTRRAVGLILDAPVQATDAGADAGADAPADAGVDASSDASTGAVGPADASSLQDALPPIDAAGDADPTPVEDGGDHDGCGCTTAGAPGAFGPVASIFGLVIVAAGRWRRRRCSPIASPVEDIVDRTGTGRRVPALPRVNAA